MQKFLLLQMLQMDSNTGQGSLFGPSRCDAVGVSSGAADIPDSNYSIKASFTDAYGQILLPLLI